MHRDIVAEASGRWPEILANLGVSDRALSGKHTACPMCGGTDRFRFDDKEGRGRWICSRCGAGDGFGLVQRIRGIDFKEAVKLVEPLIGLAQKVEPKKEPSGPEKMAAIKRVWASSQQVEAGDPVWKYLERRCGIRVAPNDVRFHPSLRYDESQSFHAMVAVIRNVKGAPVSLHRTWLTQDGQKAPVDPPKKAMPAVGTIKGAAIRLSAVGTRDFGVAEGIETALCASTLWQMPVWSCVSAGGIETFEPPFSGEITVFADNDENAVGQIAAYKLKARMHEQKIHVDVKIPERGDWADVFERGGV